MHYDVLKKSMYHYKNTEEGRKIMCEKVQKYGDEREKYGILEGESKTRIENAKSMIALSKLTLEDIATCSGLPLSKVKELAG